MYNKFALTDKQRLILKKIEAGEKQTAIAKELGVSTTDVNTTYKSALFRKLKHEALIDSTLLTDIEKEQVRKLLAEVKAIRDNAVSRQS